MRPRALQGAVENRAFAGDGVRGGAAAIQPQGEGIQRQSEHKRVGEPGDWQSRLLCPGQDTVSRRVCRVGAGCRMLVPGHGHRFRLSPQHRLAGLRVEFQAFAGGADEFRAVTVSQGSG
jgi:hypothetical protein